MCLIALAVLTGCSKDNQSDPSTQTIEIQDADLTFELPATWIELDPAEATKAVTDDDLMAELVERHGPDTKQFGPVQVFISTTGTPLGPEPLFVASAKGVENGVLSEMTVNATSLDELPAIPELKKHYREHSPRPGHPSSRAPPGHELRGVHLLRPNGQPSRGGEARHGHCRQPRAHTLTELP
jgi:hypothetical protein